MTVTAQRLTFPAWLEDQRDRPDSIGALAAFALRSCGRALEEPGIGLGDVHALVIAAGGSEEAIAAVQPAWAAYQRTISVRPPRPRAAGGLPPGFISAIEGAVEAEGGDEDDVADLADVWRRAIDDSNRRAGAIRTAVRLRRCRCQDGGRPDGSGCCQLCIGRLPTTSRAPQPNPKGPR